MARHYKQGKYSPKNPQKYKGDIKNIVYRSGWEYKFMTYLDLSNSVIEWASEPFPIEYYSSIEKKSRRYFVDFIVKVKGKNGKTQIQFIEIKPFAETLPPKQPKTKSLKAKMRFLRESKTYHVNQDKWKACEAFAKKHNAVFKVFTEYELGIKKRG